MTSKSHRRGSFASSVDDLVPLLSIQPQQIQAAIDPHQPIATLAQRAGMAERIIRRPIDAWSRDPSIARRVNDVLAGSKPLLN